jgi:lipopolysaccharide/colanic/teichoic acid biosynthesis glycosyltransferase
MSIAVPQPNGGPSPDEPATGPAEHRPSHSGILSEALFSHLLVRERKRSERSNRRFILMLLKSHESLDPATSRAGKAMLEALSATTRGTDILGWMKWPTVVGIIFPEIGDTEPDQAVETIRARLEKEFLRLGVTLVGGLSLEFRVFPEPSEDGASSGPGEIDATFHPDLHQEEHRRRWSGWVKRVLDITLSFALLVGLAPLIGVVAVIVRLTSPGPVLFRQVRLGKMGKRFRMLKFRTMYFKAGDAPHHEFVAKFIKEGAQTQKPAANAIFKLTNDPRVTPVGRVLRKTSIDELPQLWNVLIGEMSLVGPRPPLPYELRLYAPWHRRRILEATPGVTGLWQVKGRSRTTFDEMVRLDLHYARTRSLWTDLHILLLTPAAVLSGKGAG